VIFGLARFSEGVDLPGKLCEHVFIAKLPFAVPDSPVDATYSEWLQSVGRNPFMEISVPDACTKLVQACGRLIRTETDKGRIVLLDRRVVTKRYGNQMLNSLPPFRRVIEPIQQTA
jgi:ATP-dependent DNA helicase DinG